MRRPQSRLGPQSGRALFGAGGVYTVGRLFQLLAGVLVVPVLTRALGPRDLGTVAAALVVVQLLAMLSAAGLPAALTRVAVDPGGREHAKGIVLTVLVLAAPTAGIAHLTGPMWSSMFNDLEYGTAAQLAVLTAVPLAVLAAAQSVFQAQRRAARFVATTLLATAGGQALGLALVFADADRSPSRYLAGNLIASSLAAMLAVGFTGLSTGALRDRRPLRTAFAIGLPTVPHLLGLYLLAAGDRVVIERLRGLDDVGRYQVAYALGTLGLVALTALNNAWAPLVYGAPDERRWTDLADTSSVLTHLAALAAAGLAFGAPLVVRVAAPAEYDHHLLATTSAIVGLAVVPYVAYLARVHVLFQTGRTRSLAVITPVTGLGNVLLNLAVIPVAGLPGAACVTVATYTAQALLVHQRSTRMAAVAWNLREDARSWAAAASLVVIGASVPGTGPWLALRTVAATGFTLAVILRIVRLLRPVAMGPARTD